MNLFTKNRKVIKMKKLILLLLIPFFFITDNVIHAETTIPDRPANGIYDPNHYLSENTSAELEKENSSSDIQIGIYIVDTLDGKSIEEQANEVARNWKIGHSDSNKGALIAIAINDRKFRIETSNELNTILTDSKAKRILDNSKSYMKNKDYDGAIINIIQQIKNIESNNSSNNVNKEVRIKEDDTVSIKEDGFINYLKGKSFLIGALIFSLLTFIGGVVGFSLHDEYSERKKIKEYKKLSDYNYDGPDKLYPNNSNWIKNPSWTEEKINKFLKDDYIKRSKYDYKGTNKLYPEMKNFIPNESWTAERITSYKNKIIEETRIRKEKEAERLKREREDKLKRSQYDYKGPNKLYPRDYGFIENETWTAILIQEYLDSLNTHNSSYYDSSSSSYYDDSSSSFDFSSSSSWDGGGFDGGGASGDW